MIVEGWACASSPSVGTTNLLIEPGDVTLDAASPVWEAALPPARFRARTVVLAAGIFVAGPLTGGAVNPSLS